MGGKKRLIVTAVFFLALLLAGASQYNTFSVGNTTLLTYNATGYINEPLTFRAVLHNASNSTDFINGTGITCTLSIDGVNYSMAFTPNYSSGVDAYNYTLNFTTQKSESYNVTCNATARGFDVITGNASLNIYNSNISSWLESSTDLLPAETIPLTLYANYTDYPNNTVIANSSCQINISGTAYSMTYENSTGKHFYNYTFNTSGVNNYTATCSASNYSTRTISTNISILPYQPGFETYQDFTTIKRCGNSFLDIDENGLHEYFYSGSNFPNFFINHSEYNTTNFADTNYSSNLSGLRDGSYVFADFDNDGDADFISCGEDLSGRKTRIYENSNQNFVLKSNIIPNITRCSISIFDSDNDGYQEILISGLNGTDDNTDPKISYLYKNNKNFNFALVKNFTGVAYSTTGYADFNNTGYKDFIIFGSTSTSSIYSAFERNNLSSSNFSIPLFDITQGSAVFFDFDNDNDLDAVIQGSEKKDTSTNSSLKYYLNNGSALVLYQNLSGHFVGSLSSGDFDNDGYGDIYVSGQNISGNYSGILYTFNGTHFVQEYSSPFKGYLSSSSVFDFNDDGSLDLAVCGEIATNTYQNTVFSNNISLIKKNYLPNPPVFINSSYDYNQSTLMIWWGSGSDDLTPMPGLYYHLRIGTSQNPNSVLSGIYSISSNPQQGYLGNMMQARNITLFVPNGQYQMQVQTIDSGLKRSNWSNIHYHDFDMCSPPPTGDWTMTADCTITQNINFSNDINISSGAIVTFQNINFTFDKITVSNATLVISNSTLTGNSSISTDNKSALHIQRSTIRDTQFITSGNTTITDTNISCDYCFAIKANSTINSSVINSTSVLFNITNATLNLINSNVTGTSNVILNSASIEWINTSSINPINTSISTGAIYVKWPLTILFNDSLSGVQADVYNTTTKTINSGSNILLTEKTINSTGEFNNTDINVSFSKYNYFTKSIILNITESTQTTVALEEMHIPDYDDYNNNQTTNFTYYATLKQLGNLSNATISDGTYCTIKFLQNLNLTDANLSRDIILSQNSVYINATREPRLNVSANITFTNLDFNTEPILYKDNTPCNSCTNKYFNLSAKSYRFTTTSFSNYSLISNRSIVDYNTDTCNVISQNTTIRIRYVDINNSPVNNSYCNITIDANTSAMNKNATYYYMTIANNETGKKNYTVTCWENASMNKTFQLNIRATNKTVGFAKIALNPLISSSALFIDKNEFMVSGEYNSSNYIYIYDSDLSLQSNNFTALSHASFAGFDFNNDGTADLVGTGQTISSNDKLFFYKKLNSSFMLYDNSINGLVDSSIDIFDFDRDGDTDILVTGDRGGLTTTIYENTGGNFSSYTSFSGIDEGAGAFTDYNNDGLADIIITGSGTTLFYLQNSTGNFTPDYSQSIINTSLSTISLADIDSDGDDDLFISGEINSSTVNASVYLNINGTFTYSPTWSSELIGLRKGGSVLFDYDMDGDLDLINYGQDASNSIKTVLYENNQTTLKTVNSINFTGVFYGSIAVSDYDSDGDIDILITGETNTISSIPKSELYVNDISECIYNTPPSSPALTNVSFSSGKAFISWNTSTDNETSDSALYYNVRVGNAFGNHTIKSGIIATSSNPTRPGFGNAGQNSNLSLNIADQCLIASVQSIDHSLQASPWSNILNFSSTETCDGFDNDCDGVIDNGFDDDNDNYYDKTYCVGIYADLDWCDDNNNAHTSSECNPLNLDSYKPSSGSVAITVTAPENEAIENTTENNATKEEIIEEQEKPPEQSSDERIMWDVLSNNLKHKRKFYFEHGTTHIIETLKNYNPFALENLTVTITIPKRITNSAFNISSLNEFNIIEEDPVISYGIPAIATFKEHSFEYAFPGKVNPEGITIEVESKNDSRIDEFEKLVEQTKEVVEIKKTITRNNETNTTHYNLEFDFKNESILYNVTVYHEIPKCLINFIKEEDIISDINFEIVNEDPLIAWHFDKVIKGDKIQFAIKALADSNCDDEGETLAVAKSILILNKNINYKNVAYSFLIIVAVLIVLITFASITDRIKENKKEVFLKEAHDHYKEGGRKSDLSIRLHDHGATEKEIEHAQNLGAKNRFHHHLLRFEIGIEEAIILIILALNFLETFKVLSGDAGFIKNIISWTVLSYLLYHVSLTKILFGTRKKGYDILLLITFFLMTLKNFTAVALSSIVEARFFRDIYTLAIKNNAVLETYLFTFGVLFLLALSIIMSLTFSYQKPSVISLIRPRKNKALKIILTYTVLIFFFIAVYSLIFEWLAIAVDAPLTFITAIASIFLLIKHHKKISITKALFSIGTGAEGFYHKIIQLFQYKKMFGVAISGVLILHILADIGIYLLPYGTGLKNTLYSTSAENTPIFTIFSSAPSLFSNQVLGLNTPDTITLFFVYISNIAFMLLLFSLPAYLWYKMYKNRKTPTSLLQPINLTRPIILLIIFTAIITLTIPAFSFQTAESSGDIIKEEFTGLEINTQKAETTPVASIITFSNALIITIGFYLFILKKERKRIIKNTIFLAVSGFTAYYLTSFLISTAKNSLSVIEKSDNILLTASVAVIALANTAFYGAGTILLFIELWKRREFPFEFLRYKHLQKLTRHHDMHHVHYYGVHDEIYHGKAKHYIKNYIGKSLQAGRGIHRTVEFLKEHDWPEELITKATKKLETTKRSLIHKHRLNLHQKDKRTKLLKWYKSHINDNTTQEILTEQALDKGYTEDDIEWTKKEMENTTNRKSPI